MRQYQWCYGKSKTLQVPEWRQWAVGSGHETKAGHEGIWSQAGSCTAGERQMPIRHAM